MLPMRASDGQCIKYAIENFSADWAIIGSANSQETKKSSTALRKHGAPDWTLYGSGADNVEK